MKSPAFQFYAGDFLVSTATMSAEEVGGYIRLLCYEWTNGPLTNDPAVLERLSGCTSNALAMLVHKFSIDENGKLYNERLEQTRRDRDRFTQSRAKNAALRWKKHDSACTSNASAELVQSTSNALQSSVFSLHKERESSKSGLCTSIASASTPTQGTSAASAASLSLEIGDSPKPEKSAPPKTPLQLRAEKLHGKRETTPWDRSEQKAWKLAEAAVAATSSEEWAAMEFFYSEPQEKTYARKDLATTLNNWSGEVQKAMSYVEKHPYPTRKQSKPVIAAIPEPNGWREMLENSKYGPGGAFEAKTWGELPRDIQAHCAKTLK